jgi:predicted nucleic acid-binding protein
VILLDTNVVSAVMAPTQQKFVLDWLNRQDSVTLFLSTITIAEIGYGLRVLPYGKHRLGLEDRFDRFVVEGFEQRVLPFDEGAAYLYGEIMGHRQELGRPLGALDGQIASIARANHLSVATRNVRDFEECGVDLINPFDI